MIKFFRKIRQKLLAQGKFTQYLKYAVGEIVLVVIGILIALQINNWNEVQKSERWEQRFLTDLKNELIKDQQQLENVLHVQMTKGDALRSTMELLDVAEPEYKAKIDSAYGLSQLNNPTFFPTTGVYDSGISSGKIETIHNDSLKYRIMNLYNHYYTRLVYNGEILDEVVGKVDWDKIMYYDEGRGRIRTWDDVVSFEFRAIVDYEWAQTNVYNLLAKQNLHELEQLIEMITIELEQ